MASVMICCARAAAVSRASASSRLTRLAASRRASASICLRSSSRASSAVSPATRCSSRCRSATSWSARRRAAARASCWRAARSRAAQILLEPIGGGQPIGQRARLVGERLLEVRSRRGARASASRLRRRARAPFRGFERRFLPEASPRPARPAEQALGLSSARPMVSAAIRLAAGDPPASAPRRARTTTRGESESDGDSR